ncbi:MAG: hypothetical protein LUD16_07320 [Lachnospiraceae bacterium]|nr:hypothetical protein [Lachnospiraceae bacterium]
MAELNLQQITDRQIPIIITATSLQLFKMKIVGWTTLMFLDRSTTESPDSGVL